MAYQPFLIAPFGTGLETDLEPWMSPPDAFSDIVNGHIHHGVIEKREGFFELDKLVHGHSTNLDIVAPGISQADPGVVTVTSTTDISNGDTIVIYDVTGMTEVNGNEYVVANKTGTTFELTDSAGANIDTSGFTAWAAGGVVYLIPGSRVMGLHQYIDPKNVKDLIAFDKERACRYDATNQRFDPLDDADIFDSSDDDFVWADNWASTSSSTATTLSRLYFTNGKQLSAGLNGIRFYTSGATTTTSYAPSINGATTINGCKLLFAFKQRLLLLHTFEGANTYPQRVRWCQIQNPDDANAWDDNVAGKGGFVDAPTGEQIISARALQNGIIVFFTNSVWTLSPVSDPALPFRWDKINDFRACDGKMATVEYDRYVVALGIRGITATDGVETRRIDNRIEEFVSDEINADSFSQVFAARSFANRRTWMLYPRIESDDNNSTLILDDESSAFSKYDIDMNVLGYTQNVLQDLAAQDFTAANNLDKAAQDFGNETALSFFLSGNTELFIGGDTSGVVYVLESGVSDSDTSISFRLNSAAWAPYRDTGQEAQFGFIDFFVDTDQQTKFVVKFYKDNNEDSYVSQEVDCLPNLNYCASIANAVTKTPASDGVRITAGKHGFTTGDEIYIYGVVGMGDINDEKFSVTVIDGDTFDITVDATNFGTYTAGGVIVERKFYRTKTWKRAYAGGYGYQHRIEITSEGSEDPFRIHAFKPYFRPRGKRTI